MTGGPQTPMPDRETVITRTIDAPREVVFAAFTEERHLSRWWGPDGFTTTTREFAFREGGAWDFDMHAPDGTDYPNLITWREIVPPERIAMTHGESAGDPDAFESVITFVDQGETTEIEMRARFPTAALRDRAIKEFNSLELGRQTLDCLAAYVARLQDHDR